MWQLRTRGLQMGVRTLVMGIVNVTPDSFSGDGLGVGPGATERAVAHGLRLLEEGAGALDLGGESTRPGSGAGSERALTAMEEQDRVLPVVEGLLRERPEAVISIDTYRSSTAQAAVAAGAEIVNDVSGLLWDDGMAAACAALGCGVVVMHTRGRPGEWKTLPALARDEVVPLVLDGLGGRLGAALAAGMGSGRRGRRTMRCLPGRTGCWRWAGRCWPGCHGSRFWARRWVSCAAAGWRHRRIGSRRRSRRAWGRC
jgi:dihydropteroate synthase